MHNYPQPNDPQIAKNKAYQDDMKYKLSARPQKAMQEMMETIDTLRNVYERETNALKASDAKSFLAMQDEKLEIARRYQSGISQILKRKDEMKSVDPDMRAKLETMQKEFSELTHENMKALERMNRTMNSLGNTLQKAVAEATRKDRTFAYTAQGRVNTDEAKTITTGSISETA